MINSNAPPGDLAPFVPERAWGSEPEHRQEARAQHPPGIAAFERDAEPPSEHGAGRVDVAELRSADGASLHAPDPPLTLRAADVAAGVGAPAVETTGVGAPAVGSVAVGSAAVASIRQGESATIESAASDVTGWPPASAAAAWAGDAAPARAHVVREAGDIVSTAADAAAEAPPWDTDAAADDRMSHWLEFGPLAPYLANEQVTDLFVNGAAGLWTDDGRALSHQRSWSADERSLRELAVRLISLGGRHIDEATPCVDVRLHDGIRVHAVLPPVSTTGTLLSVRIPRQARFTLAELADAGTMTAPAHGRLLGAIRRRENILITGAAGSGKTTLLSALLGEASVGERIVTIEDVAELRINHPHVVSLESRQPNLEGAGAIGLERLVREALRMRPDRLVLGECRGAEVRELLAALNTGHDGGAGTLHANSLADVPTRIEALGALAGMTQHAIARQTVSAIGLVVHLERAGGMRRVAQLGRFGLDGRGQLVMAEESAATADARTADARTDEARTDEARTKEGIA